MTSKERFITALQKKKPDRVPICEFTIDDNVIDKMCSHCSYDAFIDQFDFDAVVITPNKKYVKKIGKNRYLDAWGTEFIDTGEYALIEDSFPIYCEESYKNYIPPDPLDDVRLKELEKMVLRYKNKKAIVFTVSDSFSRPRKLLGMEQLLLGYIEEPSYLLELIDMTVDYQMKLIEQAIQIGADVIFSADDYAGNLGPLMSPTHFEKFIYPGLKRLVAKTHEMDSYYIKHTDGNIWQIMDLLLDTGIDGLNPIDPGAGMDIKKVKEYVGDKVCIIGNVDCKYTLCDATLEEVRQEVLYLLTTIAPEGGYIISSSNSIHSGVKPENYLEMIDVTKRNGIYPIRI